MAVILVGAMLVSGIEMVFKTDHKPQHLSKKVFNDEQITLERGAELGHFHMGSTVILLFAKDAIAWQEKLKAQSQVIMGEAIGRLVE
jgi:phosphatidylserine decarboxylase